MIRYTSRVICAALPGRRLDELRLPLMVTENSETMRTAFTVSVDARTGTTTGISAADRATTVRALDCPDTRPEDLSRPGHIFPLRRRTVSGAAAVGGKRSRLGRCHALAPRAISVVADGLMTYGKRLYPN